MLHALVLLTSPQFQLRPNESITTDHLDDETPITSLTCRWKAPKKRKEGTLLIAQVKFEKHVYGKPITRQYDLLENFDPRPTQYRGTAKGHLQALLDKVCGKNLCISDESYQSSSIVDSTVDIALPSTE